MSFDPATTKEAAARLAGEGIFVGTSSWKYPGWRGQLYTDDRYIYRGAFSETRLQRLCLGEYAEVFKTVCVDAAYYNFPSRRWLEELTGQVPADFLFAFKVTDAITLKRFPVLPRFGQRAGRSNPYFLNADLFASAFLSPCEPVRQHVGLLMFEFSQFTPADYARGRDFAEALDAFLGRLPAGWPYGVEIRNRTFLHPELFSCLARHRVSYVYNSWQDMPPLGEQMALAESRTNPARLAARLLLRPGRKYDQAVSLFSPYAEIRDPYPEGRAAGANLIRQARQDGAKAFIYVNNRFEGNALETIAGIFETAAR
jgi:uncharacterized protein YecE (DUF72 family)